MPNHTWPWKQFKKLLEGLSFTFSFLCSAPFHHPIYRLVFFNLCSKHLSSVSFIYAWLSIFSCPSALLNLAGCLCLCFCGGFLWSNTFNDFKLPFVSGMFVNQRHFFISIISVPCFQYIHTLNLFVSNQICGLVSLFPLSFSAGRPSVKL